MSNDSRTVAERLVPAVEWQSHLDARIAFVCVIAVTGIMQALLAPGLFGTDDLLYASRGAEIAAGIWRASDNVGEIRYGINLPIAMFIRLLGSSQWVLSAWSFVCSTAEVAIVFFVAYTAWGLRSAILAALLLALTPLHLLLGTLPLADAPLALAFTGALAAFFNAERRQDTRWYVIAGAAAGFSWWVKPHAAIPFLAMFAGYAILRRTWNRQWLWVAIAWIVVVALEPLMYWGKFGDPMFGINALLKSFDRSYIASDSQWGSSSPAFYFRQMFLDGRDMWLLPYFALPGIWLLVRPRASRIASPWSPQVAFWGVGLIAVFSFFVISVSPLKWIPKQENYAEMFLAPLALAKARPNAVVLASAQAVKAAYLDSLLAGGRSGPSNLVAIDRNSLEATLRSTEARERIIVVDSSTPELMSPSRLAAVRQILDRCWQPDGTIVPQSSGAGLAAARGVALVRPHLPAAVDRQLSFTDRLIAPDVVPVYRSPANEACPA